MNQTLLKKHRGGKPQKTFFFSDKTGREVTGSLSQTDMQKNFFGERSYDGKAASTWAIGAAVGDQWENNTKKIVRIS